MRKSDFYFDLPGHLIAQSPAEPRDAARLMRLDRHTGAIEHHHFAQLPSLLRAGDLLVLNNSKVLPARLIGHKQDTGGVCELLLLRQKQGDDWECLARPGKRMKAGTWLLFGDGSLTAEIRETLPNGSKIARFCYDTQTLYEKLDQFGRMPLPPYITRQLEDNSDYQTVYAKHPGSAAAPTAGLHFTDELFLRLREQGINTAEVTLHVGLGTFRPVQEEEVEAHVMHSEWYELGTEAADAIQRTKQQGGRVIAVGTTSCRVLESVARQHGEVRAATGETDIFLYPGKHLAVIDGLITNFHLPESTLIMLVAAFCGTENTLTAYRKAIECEYRFFSFGDAMLIL